MNSHLISLRQLYKQIVMDDKSPEEKEFANELNNFHSTFSKLSLKKHQFQDCLKDVFNDGSSLQQWNNYVSTAFCLLRFIENFLKFIVTFIFVVIFVYMFVTSHSAVQKIILRNSQNFIYPIMRTLRIWTLPLLRKYEFLSDWHEEECLVKNPFYYELPLDCWPCEDIRTLVDLTGFRNFSDDYVYNEKPFIVRDSLKQELSFEDLQQLYSKYSLGLDRGTAKFLCSERDFCSPKDVFTKEPPAKNTFQVMWKINRVAAARVIRKIFPRPYFIPNSSEVALERYLYLSGAEAPQFFLPLTDFANVWVAQGQGYRLIVLDPSEPCISNCSSVSVLLRPKDVLYYNWQFWRPRSRPANFCEDMSITYIGSFY